MYRILLNLYPNEISFIAIYKSSLKLFTFSRFGGADECREIIKDIILILFIYLGILYIIYYYRAPDLYKPNLYNITYTKLQRPSCTRAIIVITLQYRENGDDFHIISKTSSVCQNSPKSISLNRKYRVAHQHVLVYIPETYIRKTNQYIYKVILTK